MSVKSIDVAAAALTELVNVYRNMDVLPGNTGFDKKDLVAVNPEMSKLWLTAELETALLLTVPLTPLETISIDPLAAELGMLTTTEKLHESPGAKLPPEKVSVEVPDKLDPTPQISACVALSETRPASAAFKSMLKPTSVTLAVALLL